MIIFNIVILLFFIIFQFRNKGIPSILYHQVNDEWGVSEELFESHLLYLKKHNYKTLTIDEYTKGLFDKKDKNIILTFDDGYFDNYRNAYRLLKKYDMKASIFLNTFFIKDEIRSDDKIKIESNNEANYKLMYEHIVKGSDGSSWQYMTWNEIIEMKESGLIDFQAHSHKHMPIFTDIKLRGIHKGKSRDASDLFLYGKEVEEGYPVFSKRGECSTKGYKIDKNFFDEFKDFYLAHSNEKLDFMQAFVDDQIGRLIIEEGVEEAENRIFEEGKLNKDIIEKKLNTKVTSFCWPWGHRSCFARKVLEKAGYQNFVTTTKGTNSILCNNKKIRRIELRNFTLKKFILNVELNRNLLLGRLYELVS